jgi:hypothetical protein
MKRWEKQGVRSWSNGKNIDGITIFIASQNDILVTIGCRNTSEYLACLFKNEFIPHIQEAKKYLIIGSISKFSNQITFQATFLMTGFLIVCNHPS